MGLPNVIMIMALNIVSTVQNHSTKYRWSNYYHQLNRKDEEKSVEERRG